MIEDRPIEEMHLVNGLMSILKSCSLEKDVQYSIFLGCAVAFHYNSFHQPLTLSEYKSYQDMIPEFHQIMRELFINPTWDWNRDSRRTALSILANHCSTN